MVKAINKMREVLKPWKYTEFINSLLKQTTMLNLEVMAFIRDYIFDPAALIGKAIEFMKEGK